MVKISEIKCALMAATLMLSGTTVLTSCGSDDENTITPTDIMVNYTISVRNAELDSLRMIAKNGTMYLRYTNGYKVIHLEAFTGHVSKYFSYHLTGNDSIDIGIQLICLAKDSSELAALKGTFNFKPYVSCSGTLTYSDGNNSWLDSINVINFDSTYTLPADSSRFFRDINNSTANYGGIQLVGSSLNYVYKKSENKSTYMPSSLWKNNKFER